MSTPGLQGLLGLLIAKLIDLPLAGTYHTDIPQYVGKLTADQFCEDIAWSYVIWFYNQFDEVMMPSRSSRDQLLRRGLFPEKARPCPAGWTPSALVRSTGTPSDGAARGGPGSDSSTRGASRRKRIWSCWPRLLSSLGEAAFLTLIVAGDGPYRART